MTDHLGQSDASDVNRIGIDAATEVLRDAYGDRDPRAVAEECFDAYVKAIQGHPHSAANILRIINERDRLRRFVNNLIAGRYFGGGWADKIIAAAKEAVDA